MVSYSQGGVYLSQGQHLFPVFSPDAANNVQQAYTVAGGTVAVALPTTSMIVRVHSNQDCFLNFGGSGVTAATTSMPHPAGAEYYGVPDTATHVAVLADGTDGTLTITPMDV